MNVSEIMKTTSKEHVINTIKTIVSWIPTIWWPISSLMTDHLPNYKMERLTNFIDSLSNDIENLKNLKIDEEYLKSENFWYLFEKTLKSVFIEHRKEKLEIYKNLLLNFIIKIDIKAEEKEYILSIIDDLEIIHIIVLSIFINPISQKWNWWFWWSLWESLRDIFREIWVDETLRKAWLLDLENKWLLKSMTNNLNTMLSTRPNLNDKLTPLWEKVKNLILIPTLS